MKTEKKPEVVAEMIRLYRIEKWTLDMLASHFGIKKQTIHYWLAQSGVSFRSRGRRPKLLDRKKVIELYVTQKQNLGETAKNLKTTYVTLDKELIRHGIDKRRRNINLRKTPEIFDMKIGEEIIIDTPETKTPSKTLHGKAWKMGIKISVKKLDGRRMRVTRRG